MRKKTLNCGAARPGCAHRFDCHERSASVAPLPHVGNGPYGIHAQQGRFSALARGHCTVIMKPITGNAAGAISLAEKAA